MPFVLDASVTLAWVLAEEQDAVVQRAAQLLETGQETGQVTGVETGPDRALVPELWWYEVRSILLVSERRGRISAAGTAQFLKSLANLRIEIDTGRDDQPMLALAREHKLTAYDAAYLALAIRERLPLATLDGALQAAARSSGIRLLA